MATKRKKAPKAPRAPKSTSPQAISAFERRVKEFEKKCAEIAKHNKLIEDSKKKREQLKDRVAKARRKAVTGS